MFTHTLKDSIFINQSISPPTIQAPLSLSSFLRRLNTHKPIIIKSSLWKWGGEVKVAMKEEKEGLAEEHCNKNREEEEKERDVDIDARLMKETDSTTQPDIKGSY